MSEDMIRKVLYYLHKELRKTEISLTNAEDRRMKNPDCCAICEEIRNLTDKKSVLMYLIEEEMKKIG